MITLGITSVVLFPALTSSPAPLTVLFLVGLSIL